MNTVKTFARQLSFSRMRARTLGSAIVSCGSILDEEDVVRHRLVKAIIRAYDREKEREQQMGT